MELGVLSSPASTGSVFSSPPLYRRRIHGSCMHLTSFTTGADRALRACTGHAAARYLPGLTLFIRFHDPSGDQNANGLEELCASSLSRVRQTENPELAVSDAEANSSTRFHPVWMCPFRVKRMNNTTHNGMHERLIRMRPFLIQIQWYIFNNYT